MKKTLQQFISLGVMLLLIAVVISLLPETTVTTQTQQEQAATDVAVSEVARDDGRNN